MAASFNTPTLFQIARDLTQMQIEASVAEADIAKVKPGQRVDFSVDAYGTRMFTGMVDQIRLNPTTQQNVVTYTVIVKAANPDGALLPGMTANADFIVAEKKGALLPTAALSFKPEGWKPQRAPGNKPRDPDEVTVFALVGGKPQARQVRLGASDTDNSEIVSGNLKAGETVITGKATPDKKAGGIFSGPPDSKYKNDTTGKAGGAKK